MKVLICGYNDADTIRRTLDSVRGFDVHYFDGRFNDFPGEGPPWSTDRTTQIIAEYPNVTFHIPRTNETQCEKRTRMFSVLKEGEYGWKIDGDEVVISRPDYTKIKGEADVYWGWTLSNAYDYPYMKPMIFKKHEGMHYAGRHHFLFDKNKKLIASDQHMGEGYTHANLDFRVFNIRDRNPHRDKAKLRFLNNREEAKVAGEHGVYGEQAMRLHEYRALAPRMPSDVLLTGGVPDYTFGLTFSRPWALKRYFENLDKVLLPYNIEVVCVVDTDDLIFYRDVQDELRRRAVRFQGGIKTYMTGNPPPFEKKRVNDRRLRIARSMHIILTEAKGRILLGSEDDSLPPPEAYMKLLDDLYAKDADFAQGSIVGRWEPIIPAWHVEERDGQLYRVWTGEKRTGIEEIQGVGWYTFVAKTDMLRSFKLNWDTIKHLGPDFQHGYDMWKAGYRLLHDHDIHVTHYTQEKDITLDTPTVVLEWKRDGDIWESKPL